MRIPSPGLAPAPSTLSKADVGDDGVVIGRMQSVPLATREECLLDGDGVLRSSWPGHDVVDAVIDLPRFPRANG